jgi:hypothetical protein
MADAVFALLFCAVGVFFIHSFCQYSILVQEEAYRNAESARRRHAAFGGLSWYSVAAHFGVEDAYVGLMFSTSFDESFAFAGAYADANRG